MEVITVVYDGRYDDEFNWGSFFYAELDRYEGYGTASYGHEITGGGSSKNSLSPKDKARKLIVCIEGTTDAFNICIKSWDAKIANRKEDCELWGSLGTAVPIFGESLEKHINRFMGCGRTANKQGVDKQVSCSNLRTRQKAVCRKKYT